VAVALAGATSCLPIELSSFSVAGGIGLPTIWCAIGLSQQPLNFFGILIERRLDKIRYLFHTLIDHYNYRVNENFYYQCGGNARLSAALSKSLSSPSPAALTSPTSLSFCDPSPLVYRASWPVDEARYCSEVLLCSDTSTSSSELGCAGSRLNFEVVKLMG
jgi:hypothetical protein